MHKRTGLPDCQKNSFLSFAEWFLVDLLSAIKHHEIQTKMHIQGRRTVKKIGGNKYIFFYFIKNFVGNICPSLLIGIIAKIWWGTVLTRYGGLVLYSI